MKIYVGNLPFSTNDDELRKLFDPHGMVTSASVVTDRETGRSRGFGFVEMANDDEARAAMDVLNGQLVGGRPLVVNEARPRAPRGPGGGGGGGGRPRGGGGGGGFRGGDRGGRGGFDGPRWDDRPPPAFEGGGEGGGRGGGRGRGRDRRRRRDSDDWGGGGGGGGDDW